MTFNNVLFLPFFLLVVLVAAGTRGRTRDWLLTVFSYVFYALSGPAFVVLLFASSFVDFHIGRALARLEAPGRRRALLAVSIAVNMGLLATFKYAGFVSLNLNRVFASLGVPVTLPYVDLPLPAGISFYTFAAMSYTIDVYRRQIRPADRMLDFFLFVSFFPHLVAGPIVRAAQFLPQLRTYRPLQRTDVLVGLEFVLVGLFKKMIVADNISHAVAQGFAAGANASPANVLLAAMLFAVQIYCDFSGYTDVARGTARILGFDFPENFRWPYFSETVQEFWRRWHMTLSFWIRDYLYISLGGSRGSRGRRAFNLFVTWFLCGLWHGAQWKFVLWGLYHGLFVDLSRYGERWRRRLKPLFVVATFYVVCLGWILFRAPEVGVALRMMLLGLGLTVARPFSLARPGIEWVGLQRFFAEAPYCGWALLAAVALLAVVHWVTYRAEYAMEGRVVLARLPAPAFAVAAGASLGALFLLTGPEELFIYFAF
jgi:D-alanyl-lipoteichoic acid acyltransferase DltB (MBOAT superfamily)